MKLNIIKKVSIFSTATLLFTGCNIYRQMVIPTPYYPNQNTEVQNQSTEVQNQDTQAQTTTNNVIDATSEVKQGLPPQSDQVITPIKQDSVKVQNKTVVQRIAFPVSEYNSLAKTGKATVTGHIYINTNSGLKVYGKQTRLYLNPVTSYSTQWYQKSYLGGAKMSKVDPRLFNYLKFTTSDSNGKFEFLNVPSGSYYLIGVVKCGKQCGYNSVKNIRIAKKISVFGSDEVNIDLTK